MHQLEDMFENHSKDAAFKFCAVRLNSAELIKQNKLSYQCGETGSNSSGMNVKESVLLEVC